MGLSKEEFLELMARNEFGKKTTKRNKAIREARQRKMIITILDLKVEKRI